MPRVQPWRHVRRTSVHTVIEDDGGQVFQDLPRFRLRTKILGVNVGHIIEHSHSSTLPLFVPTPALVTLLARAGDQMAQIFASMQRDGV